jgi:hypothetical protein
MVQFYASNEPVVPLRSQYIEDIQYIGRIKTPVMEVMRREERDELWRWVATVSPQSYGGQLFCS